MGIVPDVVAGRLVAPGFGGIAYLGAYAAAELLQVMVSDFGK
jgi:hypothetical protein